jgi:uncharacterized membrane protein YfcA
MRWRGGVTMDLFVIALGCFGAAIVNAALATGGIYVMLAATSAVLPLGIAVPLQPVLAFPSLVARIFLFRRDIEWPIVWMFLPAACIASVLGARVFIALDEAVIAILLGCIMLGLIWLIPSRFGAGGGHRRFIAVGGLHGFFGTIFGVGVFLQPAVLQTKLTRVQITGTLALCLLGLDLAKTASYVGIGFKYVDYLPHILTALLSGMAGTVVGKYFGDKVPEARFRKIFKWLITLIALRLLGKGIWLLMRG